MIDFAKTLPFEDHNLDHRTEWIVGNHEDGYLTGIDNLVGVSSARDDVLAIFLGVSFHGCNVLFFWAIRRETPVSL